MINKFLDYLKNCKSVAIITHVNPDGDAFGSSMMIYEFLSENFPHVKKAIFADLTYLRPEFALMTEGVELNPEANSFEVAIVVDCGDKSRFEKYAQVFDNAKHTICFDHHKNNPNFAELNFNNVIGSNCENIFNHLYPLNMKLSQKFFKFCYVGILTDTNNLTIPMVTSNTYKTVGIIMDHGIDIRPIYKIFFQGNEKNTYSLLGLALSKAEYWFDDQVIFVNLTRQDLDACGVREDETSIIVNQVFSLYKNGLACFVASPRLENTHISMRCVYGMDVAHIAKTLGGGGHTCAAACGVKMPIEEIKNILKEEMAKNIKNYTKSEINPF